MNPTTLNLLSVSVFAFVLLSLVGPLFNISPGVVATFTTAIAGAFALDRFVAKGVGGNLLIDIVSGQSSDYRQRIIHHEAGHFLVAHLLGIPVQSYTLSAWEALKAGLPGLGGVVVNTELGQEAKAKTDAVSSRQLNQYCIISMAGIAAENQTYGNAQGGQDDKFRLKQLWQQIPPDTRATANPETQTRWALLQAQTLIEQQQPAYAALVTAMTQRESVEDCIQQIESNRTPSEPAASES